MSALRSMSIEETRLTGEVGTTRELNAYLLAGWKLILTYAETSNGGQQPRYVIAWQNQEEPVMPELLDAWELNELDRQRYR
jgi:hypothetical protein